MAQFINSNGGYKIEDSQINSRLDDLRWDFFGGKKHGLCASGDTCVTMHAWETQIEFIVANDSGYSTIRFYMNDMNSLAELIVHKFDYVRKEWVYLGLSLSPV